MVDKPAAHTSHDVVARMRKIYGQRRVGHAGTLDPDATGVLLVGLGRATRLHAVPPGHRASRTAARVVFGVATDTLDAAGAVLERAEMPLDAASRSSGARGAFVGDIEQIPPMVSAIKIDGRKLYELARAGETVERAARHVRVDALVVEEFVGGAYPEATIRVDCSSGTYVRTLAADLGTALGGCAHLGELRRLRVGSFGLDEAHSLEAIAADPERVRAHARRRAARPDRGRRRRRAAARGRARRDVRGAGAARRRSTRRARSPSSTSAASCSRSTNGAAPA